MILKTIKTVTIMVLSVILAVNLRIMVFASNTMQYTYCVGANYVSSDTLVGDFTENAKYTYYGMLSNYRAFYQTTP